MSLHTDLDALRIAALEAVAPEKAVRSFVRRDERGVLIDEILYPWTSLRRIYLLAVGKAAVPMAQATWALLGERLVSGLVVTKYEHARDHGLPPAVEVIEAGHPVPDAAGRRGAERTVRLLEGMSQDDLILVLLSGGASALLPLPAGPLELEDLQQVTQSLLRSGSSVVEINAVRKHLSRLKGGQLARLAAPATVVSLILSDVVRDPLDVIASGPTVPDPTTFEDAWSILERYALLDEIPRPVQEHLEAGRAGRVPETPKADDPLFERVQNVLIGSNRRAAQAAVSRAEALGYRALLLTTFVEGEAREVAKVAAAFAWGVRAHGDPLAAPACLVWGGETTVTVRGGGKGGRNQELALSAALALDGMSDVALMALATDGTDGPTDAAGAVVDGRTANRARERGIDLRAALRENDSYPALGALGALLRTGPTGTNVNDLLVLLVGEGGEARAE